MTAGEIAKLQGKKYSTIRSIIITWERSGRINKLLTLSAKKNILEKRAHRKSLMASKVPKQLQRPLILDLQVQDDSQESIKLVKRSMESHYNSINQN